MKGLSLHPTGRFHEHSNMLRFLRSLNLPAGARLLEVGCGYGNKMKLMAEQGLDVVGVDINEQIVKANVKAGLVCMTPDEFDRTDEKYDVLLLAHIIEHLAPGDLIDLLDHYLDRLAVGGHVIIATPIMWAGFYDEFDHVRPYMPESLMEVFADDERSNRFRASNRLELLDVRLRRAAHAWGRARPLARLRKGKRRWRFFNAVMRTIYRLSFGLIGRTLGWTGLFRNLGPCEKPASRCDGEDATCPAR